MERMKKEKSELEKELVYKPIYLPVRFFKKEAYIHIDDYKEAINKRENTVNGLKEDLQKAKEDKDYYFNKCLGLQDKLEKIYRIIMNKD